MSSAKLSGNALGTGSVTLAAPNTNSTRTLNLPDEDGTLYSSGTAVRSQKGVPAFSYVQTVAQTGLTSGVNSKITFTTSVFDTTSAVTSNRFQPTVAGYYSIVGCVAIAPTGTTSANWTSIYKNGVEYRRGGRIHLALAATIGCLTQDVIFFNGSTDYVEIYAFSNGGTWGTEVGGGQTYFSGILVAAG